MLLSGPYKEAQPNCITTCPQLPELRVARVRLWYVIACLFCFRTGCRRGRRLRQQHGQIPTTPARQVSFASLRIEVEYEITCEIMCR